ncbi:polyketide synthase [Coprinopsis cinerea AmutBmut pab1-1]|nr:polyketide synthase [Coprinopsis cinerea AmutBmut pab1-1]
MSLEARPERLTPPTAAGKEFVNLHQSEGIFPLRSVPRSVSEAVCSTYQPTSAIAVVGMALRTPGGSDVESLWEVLTSGTSTLSQIPSSRFDYGDYVERALPGRSMAVSTGNFLEDVDFFDNELFAISPREARVMDPQQRLLLHVASEALQDAGYVPGASPTFNPETFGVFVGAATSDYVHNLRENIDLHYSTGTLSALLSGRISYAMSFGGPSIVVDTACSSSGVALYQAVRSLQSGDSNAALAGGVNVISSPDLFLGLDAGRFLTQSGQPRPFDANAEGYSRAEGCVLFVLKRLEDAVRENDRILGVIDAIEVNQSGRASSITRTHAPTQTALLKKLLVRAQVDPWDVHVIEAHAAGTKVGDTTEIQAIRNVFDTGDRNHRPLYLTSIKANLGHLEAASGATSLIKVLLMLRHQTIPRQIGVATLNPALTEPPTHPILVPNEPIRWTAETKPRYAVINNYGAAGSNVAILVREFVQRGSTAPLSPNLQFTFGLSAPREEKLQAWREKMLGWLEGGENSDASNLDIAYTSTARRQLYDYRLSFPCTNDRATIIQMLRTAQVQKVNSKYPFVIFVFSGQGCQYRGMGADLYHASETFRSDVDTCARLALNLGARSFLPVLLDRRFDPAGIDESLEEQLALFAFEYSLARLWMSWGVRPAAVVGHSFGEYASLVTAGVLSLEDAISIIKIRTQLVQHHTTGRRNSSMLAVHLDPDRAKVLLDTLPEFAERNDLDIACYNSSEHCTLSGPLDQLQAFQAFLEKEHVRSTILRIPAAYHSSHLASIVEPFTLALQSTTFRPPTVPIASSVTGRLVQVGDSTSIDASYLASQPVRPVLFQQAVHSLLAHVDQKAQGALLTWVEIGPQHGHLSLLRSNEAMPADSLYLASSKKDEAPFRSLSVSLSQLYMTRVEVDWRAVFGLFGDARCVGLPFMPFHGSRFWVPYEDPSFSRHRRITVTTAFRGFCVQRPAQDNRYTARFVLPVEHYSKMIRGHQVKGFPLCPASIYFDIAINGVFEVAGNLRHQDPRTVRLEGVNFVRPLVLDGPAEMLILTVVLESSAQTRYSFNIGSAATSAQHEVTLHAQGYFNDSSSAQTSAELSSLLPFTASRIEALHNDHNSDLDVLLPSTIYDVIFPRIVCYAQEYRAFDRVVVAADRREAYGVMKLPEKTFQGTFVVHPVYLDAMVHIAGFLVNMRATEHSAYLCTDVGSLTLLREAFEYDAVYSVYCSLGASESSADAVEVGTVVMASRMGIKSIVARVEGARFQRISLGGFVKSLSTTADTVSTASPTLSAVDTLVSPIDPPPDSCIPDLKQLLSSTLHIPLVNIQDTSSFASLGLDSFASIELRHKLRSQHRLRLPSDLFQRHSTVHEAQSYIEYTTAPRLRMDPDPVRKGRGLYLIHASKAESLKAPLVLVHDGSGLTTGYDHLLDIGRDVWGIEDPYFGMKSWTSLEEMISFYANLIMGNFEGNIILGGWSFGGIVAYEILKHIRGQLSKQQTEHDFPQRVRVIGLLLLDSPCPLDRVYLSESLIDFILGIREDDLKSESDTNNKLPLESIVKAHLQHCVSLLRRHYEPALDSVINQHLGAPSKLSIPSNSGYSVLVMLLVCKEGFRLSSTQAPCLQEDVEDAVHPWFSDRKDLSAVVGSWKQFVDLDVDVSVRPVDGNHFDLFARNRVGSTSGAIQQACDIMDGQRYS